MPFGKQVNDGLGNAFPEMDDVKPTEEVWEMAFPEMDDVRERSLRTRFGKWRFPKWMTSLGHVTSRLKVTLCNTIIVLQTGKTIQA